MQFVREPWALSAYNSNTEESYTHGFSVISFSSLEYRNNEQFVSDSNKWRASNLTIMLALLHC